MATVSSGKSWREFLTKNAHLPAPFERGHESKDISTPLSINLRSVEGIIPKFENVKTEYQLCVSLYDATYRQFFGRQWVGPVLGARAAAGKQPKLPYNQNIYFHTTVTNSFVRVIVEIVALVIGVDGKQQRVSCGWGTIRPFQQDSELPDSSRNIKLSPQKSDMYYGTPRALFFMDEPAEENGYLKIIPECKLNYTICTHKTLYKIIHLLPENAIVGSNDVIPGIVDDQVTGTDNLKKPKLLNPASLVIDGLKVHLHPNIDKFEEELCELLREDRSHRENKHADATNVNIVERRLLIGVHNGWGYVDKPQTVHLEPLRDMKSRKPQASPSLRRSSMFKSSHTGSVESIPQSSSTSSKEHSNALVLKNRVQINDVLEDPAFAVVFRMEYMIGEPLSKEDRRKSLSMNRALTRTATVRWAVWNPFLQPNVSNISLALIGGPRRSPDDNFVFKLPVTDMQEESSAKTAGGIFNFQWAVVGPDGQATLPTGMSYLTAGGAQIVGSMPSVRSNDDSEGVLSESPRSMFMKKPPSGRPNSSMSAYSDSYRHGMPSDPLTPMSKMHNDSDVTESRNVSSRRESIPHPSFYETESAVMGGAYPMSQDSQGMYQPQVPGMQPHPLYSQIPGASGQMMMQQPRAPVSYAAPTYPQYPQYMPTHQPYPVEITHMREPAGMKMGMVSSSLQELPYTPVHAPIPSSGPQPKSGTGLSRASYARLYSSGFSPILDASGEAPEVIDPNQELHVNLQKEEQDPLQCNEIVFQFLAFSKIFDYDHKDTEKPGTVFFTFQFYRCPQATTQRLSLDKADNDLFSDPSSTPFILYKIEKDGSVQKGGPGLEVRYCMDPAYMKPGENMLFLQHLLHQSLHIDVWDGDSLLLIGSCSLDLKYLIRGGNEAVQVTFELDVATTEYLDESTEVRDTGVHGKIKPVGVKSVRRGQLHVRMANIGRHADFRTAQLAYGSRTLPSKTQIVVSQIAGNTTYKGGSLIAGGTASSDELKKTKIARARHLAESNREVATMLFTKKDEQKPIEESLREGDYEKKRKIARMQAIRLLTGDEEKPITILDYKKEKTERARDLKTVEMYRLHTKHDGIISMLSQTITTEHVIYPSFGTAEFFEFVLRNPYNVQQTISIHCDDTELIVVTDAREWRHFKQISNLPTQLEEGMFNKHAKGEFPEIFLRPKETVNIPMKYQTFKADQSVQPQGPVDPFKQHVDKNKKNIDNENMRSRNVKVEFRSEDEKPVAILFLKVDPQPHIIDQTFRFHHPEQAFLKKSIRLPPIMSLPGATVGGANMSQVFVRCSDPNVICESKAKQQGEPQDVFMKVALGASPQVKRFFMAIYADRFLSKPSLIWQFYVHSLQRVDVSCVEGQTSRFSLLLRGTQASRMVQTFSSHPEELQVHPNDQFMLAAGAVHELSVAVRPNRVGNKFFYINVVDVEYHQLLRTWLVCVSCREPMISRAFELTLPVGGGKGSSKRITYTNPYPQKKIFQLRTNRDDLLQFKDTQLDIEGGGTETIGLRFTPVSSPGSAELLVFINDEDDKNEETFKISAQYSLH